MRKALVPAACLCGLLVSGTCASAGPAPTAEEDGTAAQGAGAGPATGEQERRGKESPWMLLPLVSTNPKMGTSLGGLGAWLHYYDSRSQVSMFGVMAQYSTTDSMVVGLFGRASFGADHHRAEGVVGYGYVENEYQDYLGTGQPFETTDDIRAVAARYLYRFKGNWFVGAQGVAANYKVTGTSARADRILSFLGLSGINSGGLGVALMHDSRDNQDMPVKGWFLMANNVANREWLGADADYDTYRLDVRWFLEHGRGYVLALHQNNQFTVDAPPSAEASIQLRGYKIEQYLARNMSSIEAEERLRFSRRWGATVFAGVGWLYGSGDQILSNDGAYPSYGGGVQYIVKPEDHMLLSLEYADGNSSNYGIYLTLGYAW